MNIQTGTPQKNQTKQNSSLVPMRRSQVPTETDLWDEVPGVRIGSGVYCVCACELCKAMYGSRGKYSQMYSQLQTIYCHPGLEVGMAKASSE